MDKEQLIHALALDPCLAHATFFRSRWQNKRAPFHKQMELDFHSSIPRILWLVFRGAGKSTKLEEGAVLEVAFRRCKNLVVLGESESRAVERLAAIKRCFEDRNDDNLVFLQELFDVGPGDPWTETRACTSTGIMMQAFGRGQSLRGVKHLDHRPDLWLIDDVEDKESGSVNTPEARKKTSVWFASTVLPAVAPGGRMRMAATPLHPEALAPTLAKASKTWATRVYPIVYPDPDTGLLTASWPDRFSVDDVSRIREELEEIHEGETFTQEYLCQATDLSSQTFTEDMFVVKPQTPSWHAVYAIYDPARTTNKSSATTGKVVASWIGRKLVVWESDAKKWMPDEIVSDIFETEARYSPTIVGVEENGLNEWLLQPLRAEGARRGVLLPLRPLNAPKGKLDFIRGLQTYFKAHEVEFAADMPELRKQLLGFPTGHIDAPNALAYMLRLKLGVPIYENFREECIDPELAPKANTQAWLLVNTDAQITTGVLVQMQKGRLAILADWMAEGDAGNTLREIVEECSLALAPSLAPGGRSKGAMDPRAAPRLLAPKRHFEDYSLYGLRPAARKLGLNLAIGGDGLTGREEIRGLLRRLAHGSPALVVSPSARWVLRAFAGGYARDSDKVDPSDNPYRVLLEPLEAFAALLRVDSPDMDSGANYAYTADGRKYISALAR